MSLWGVRVVIGSPLEPLETSFWDPVGVIFRPLGTILGALGRQFGSLWGSFGVLWAALGRLFGGLVPWNPSDRSALHTFRILSGQNGPRWLPKWSQNGPKIDEHIDQKKDAEKDRKKEAPEATRTSLGLQKPSQIIVKHSIW